MFHDTLQRVVTERVDRVATLEELNELLELVADSPNVTARDCLLATLQARFAEPRADVEHAEDAQPEPIDRARARALLDAVAKRLRRSRRGREGRG